MSFGTTYFKITSVQILYFYLQTNALVFYVGYFYFWKLFPEYLISVESLFTPTETILKNMITLLMPGEKHHITNFGTFYEKEIIN